MAIGCFLFPIMLFAFILVLVLIFTAMTKGDSARGSLSEEDRQTMREIHADVGRMERRIESLEAILTDRGRP